MATGSVQNFWCKSFIDIKVSLPKVPFKKIGYATYIYIHIYIYIYTYIDVYDDLHKH